MKEMNAELLLNADRTLWCLLRVPQLLEFWCFCRFGRNILTLYYVLFVCSAAQIENLRSEYVRTLLFVPASVKVKPINLLLLHDYFPAVLLRYTIEGNTAVTDSQGVTSEFRKNLFSRKVMVAVLELREVLR